jgi:hypothetical protein
LDTRLTIECVNAEEDSHEEFNVGDLDPKATYVSFMLMASAVAISRF